MDLCRTWDVGILTGEPLTLTKTLVLLTDLLTGGFWPAEVAGLLGGKVLEDRTGDVRLPAGEGGASREERRPDEGVSEEEDVED